MPKSADGDRAATLKLYETLVASLPGVERKGDTMPYTSVNGHMFSLFTKDSGVVLRLPAAKRDAFMKAFKTPEVVQYGAVMKEYVEMPASLLKKHQEARKYFEASYAYVSALKPKPTTKKKAAKKN